MASERRLSANRQNAQKSTGPRTNEGKASSSKNALRHGLTAVRIVLDGEDAALYEALRRDLIEDFRPETALQMSLVQQLSGLLWRLRRAAAYEPALLTWIAHLQAKTYDVDGVDLGGSFLPIYTRGMMTANSHEPRSTAIAMSAQDLIRTGRTLEAAMAKNDLLSKVSRYEAHLVRQVERVLAQISRQQMI